MLDPGLLSPARSAARRGAANARLLAVLVVALALIGGLVFLVLGPGGERGVERGEGLRQERDEPAAELVAPAEVLAPERRSTAPAPLVGTGGLPFTAGVRLSGEGQVEGTVLERATGATVPGVRVRLMPIPPAGENLVGRVLRLAKATDMAERMKPVAVTGTDATGSFAFRGVRQGVYYIEARGPWHVPDTVTRVRVTPSGAGGPANVWVREGGRIVGRVTHPDGRPVPGAKVAGYQGVRTLLRAALEGDMVFMETQTDADGAFELVGLPPGEGYEVTATGKGFCVSHHPGVDVSKGRDTVANIVTRAGGALAGTVVGRAEPADGSRDGGEERSGPLAGVHVGAVPHGIRDLLFIEEILAQVHTQTDAEGRYVLRHVPPGEVNVIAWTPGYLPGYTDSMILPDGGANDGADLTLAAAPIATGRVTDSAGLPLPGVRVFWPMADFDQLEFSTAIAGVLAQALEGFSYPLTDADGRFQAGPFPGDPSHQLTFTKAGYQQNEVSWSPDDGELEVVLRGGGTVEGIVMDAVKAVPVTSFTIYGEDRIDVQAGSPGAWNPFTGGQLVEDEKGRFRVESVEAGTAELVFTAPGYQPTVVDQIKVVEGEVTRGVIVKLQPGGTIHGVVVSEGGAPVPGAFVLAIDRDGTGMAARRSAGIFAGAGISAEAPQSMMGYVASLGLAADAAVLTDREGRFALEEVPTGSVDLVATHRDYAPVSLEGVEVPEGRSLEGVVLELPSGGGVFGRVTDRFGEPVAGTSILAASPEGRARGGGDLGLFQGLSNDAGEYRIEHMTPGSYFLVATRGDEALHPMSFMGSVGFDLVTVPPGKLVEHDLIDESASGTRLIGRVTADGMPAEEGQMLALNFGTDNALGIDFKMARVRADGSFEFASLAPGDYSFEYQTQGLQTRREVEVPDLPEFRLDFELPRGKYAGVVVDELSGEPIERAQVTLESTEPFEAGGLLGSVIGRQGRVQSEYTDDEGRFTFERFQGGQYELRVQPPRWGKHGGMYAPRDPEIVDLREGSVRERVELQLKPALRIEGLVLDPDGTPASNVRIVAWPRDDEGMAPSRAESGEDGRFTLTSLAPIRYDVTGRKKGFGEAWLPDVQAESGSDKVLELRLTAGVETSVLVLDGGAPVSGAVATLVPVSGSSARQAEYSGAALQSFFSGEGVTQEAGVLQLGLFAPGEYRLKVRAGAREATRDVSLQEGPPVRLTIELP